MPKPTANLRALLTEVRQPVPELRAFSLTRQAVLAIKGATGYVTLSAAQCDALWQEIPQLRAYAFRA